MWNREPRWKILEPLGEGSQGRVFKALRTDPSARLSQTVALKILHSETAVDLWRKEFESLSRVRSPYCVQVHGFERIAGRPALVLEYVDGTTLRRLAGVVHRDEAMELIAQIESGLGDLHRMGLAHGDLNPHNVLVDRDGRIRLLDFGLANGEGDQARLTVAFAAPERRAGAPATPASDLFSLGRLAECLLGPDIPPEFGQYLDPRPERRRNLNRASLADRRAQVGRRVTEELRRQSLWSKLKTRTRAVGPARRRSAGWICAAALFLNSSAVSQAKLMREVSVVEIRTRHWHAIRIEDGDPRAVFAPATLILPPRRPVWIKWRTQTAFGTLQLRLRPGQTRVLTDRDFSH